LYFFDGFTNGKHKGGVNKGYYYITVIWIGVVRFDGPHSQRTPRKLRYGHFGYLKSVPQNTE
jgi:hypothetical protein